MGVIMKKILILSLALLCTNALFSADPIAEIDDEIAEFYASVHDCNTALESIALVLQDCTERNRSSLTQQGVRLQSMVKQLQRKISELRDQKTVLENNAWPAQRVNESFRMARAAHNYLLPESLHD